MVIASAITILTARFGYLFLILLNRVVEIGNLLVGQAQRKALYSCILHLASKCSFDR